MYVSTYIRRYYVHMYITQLQKHLIFLTRATNQDQQLYETGVY